MSTWADEYGAMGRTSFASPATPSTGVRWSKGRKKRAVSIEDLRSLLAYDPETGVVRWRVKPSATVSAGDVAGTRCGNGYLCVTIRGNYSQLHRVIWALMTGEWPPTTVDHRDLDRSNNRWSNLRLATMSEQGCNRGVAPGTRSGVKGVSWCEWQRRWRVQIRIPADGGGRGKRKYIGSFTSIDDAAAAYAAAAAEHHGAFARVA